MAPNIVKTHRDKYALLKTAINTEDIIYVYGPSSSGKTFLARHAMETDRTILHAYVDCNVIVTPTKLYNFIITSLKDKLKLKRTKNKSEVVGISDFISLYETLVNEAHKKRYEKIFVILDRLDLFRKTAMMDCLVALAYVDNLHLLLISIEDPNSVIDCAKSIIGKSTIYDRLNRIHLTPWTKSDIVDAICDELPETSPDLYRKFVNNVVNIVYTNHTRDYVEIRSTCQENYQKFYEYYTQQFKEIVINKEKITHELTEDDLDDFELPVAKSFSIISSFLDSLKKMASRGGMRDWNQEITDRQVVIGTSILIVAAYVAAYTKSSDDKKNFVKFQKRKVVKRAKENDRENAASRPFTLERLLHIYRSLALSSQGSLNEASKALDKQEFPDTVLSDVQLLEDLNMIEIVSGDGLSSLTRYKISTSLERDYVDRIAHQVNLNLDHIYGLV